MHEIILGPFLQSWKLRWFVIDRLVVTRVMRNEQRGQTKVLIFRKEGLKEELISHIISMPSFNKIVTLEWLWFEYLHEATITRCNLSPQFFCTDATLLCEFEIDKIWIRPFRKSLRSSLGKLMQSSWLISSKAVTWYDVGLTSPDQLLSTSKTKLGWEIYLFVLLKTWKHVITKVEKSIQFQRRERWFEKTLADFNIE